jgi:hypothetical protein
MAELSIVFKIKVEPRWYDLYREYIIHIKKDGIWYSLEFDDPSARQQLERIGVCVGTRLKIEGSYTFYRWSGLFRILSDINTGKLLRWKKANVNGVWKDMIIVDVKTVQEVVDEEEQDALDEAAEVEESVDMEHI